MLKLPKLHSLALALAMLGGTAMAADEAKKPAEVDGLLTVQSAHSAAESVKRIEEALKAKGLTIFTVIDHQQAAKDHQLDMPAASVIVFGNPKLGTPMMQQAPTLAIGRPLSSGASAASSNSCCKARTARWPSAACPACWLARRQAPAACRTP